MNILCRMSFLKEKMTILKLFLIIICIEFFILIILSIAGINIFILYSVFDALFAESLGTILRPYAIVAIVFLLFKQKIIFLHIFGLFFSAVQMTICKIFILICTGNLPTLDFLLPIAFIIPFFVILLIAYVRTYHVNSRYKNI